jgi:CO/xanthine dehydrogenase Mo-binding subunit
MEPRRRGLLANGRIRLRIDPVRSQHVSFLAQLIGIEQEQLVFISEYCGGGFGSKNPGTGDRCMAIPALLSKKAGRPVMMRFTREDEQFVGRARGGLAARVKIGFRKDGRITAFDLFEVFDSGPYNKGGDAASSARVASAEPAAEHALQERRGADEYAAARIAAVGVKALAMFDPLITEAAISWGSLVDPRSMRRQDPLHCPDKGSTAPDWRVAARHWTRAPKCLGRGAQAAQRSEAWK